MTIRPDILLGRIVAEVARREDCLPNRFRPLRCAQGDKPARLRVTSSLGSG